MLAEQRRRLIVEHLRTNGAASLKELAQITGTSEVTARRDLSSLEADGLLDRTRGGAVVDRGSVYEPTYWDKARVAAGEKSAIAELALDLIAPGDAIVVGAGTTTEALAKRLPKLRNLTVVTNSLLVAQALVRAEGVEVVVTGGTLRGTIHAVVGSAAEQSLARLRAARAFISGNGLTAERGLTTPNLAVANVDRALAAAAEEVVVLADHTKVGADTMCQTVPAAGIDHVVTDAAAPAAQLDALREAGAKVHVADTGAGDGDSSVITNSQ